MDKRRGASVTLIKRKRWECYIVNIGAIFYGNSISFVITPARNFLHNKCPVENIFISDGESLRTYFSLKTGYIKEELITMSKLDTW